MDSDGDFTELDTITDSQSGQYADLSELEILPQREHSVVSSEYVASSGSNASPRAPRRVSRPLAPTFGIKTPVLPLVDNGEVSGIHRFHSFGERYPTINETEEVYKRSKRTGNTGHASRLFVGNNGFERSFSTLGSQSDFLTNNPNAQNKVDFVVLPTADIVSK